MADGNTYPAAFAQLDGDVRLAGQIDFTDSTNQPQPPATTLSGTNLSISGLTGSVVASRYVGQSASVAPATGAHLVGDFVTTTTGQLYVCSVSGTPGTWIQCGLAPASDIAMGTHLITGIGVAATATGVPSLNQLSPVATITSGALPTATLSSGTGAQISTSRDVQAYTPVTSDGTNNAATCAVALSADNSTYTTLYTLAIVAGVNVLGAFVTPVAVRVPAGWYLKLTASRFTIGTTTYA